LPVERVDLEVRRLPRPDPTRQPRHRPRDQRGRQRPARLRARGLFGRRARRWPARDEGGHAVTGLSFRRHVFTFLLGLAGAAATVILFLAIGRALPRGEVYRVKAALPTSASLVPGSRVTMAGARV